MSTGKSTVKTMMHFICSLLAILIAILAITNLIIPRSYSLGSLKLGILTITSAITLCFSLVLIVTGLLFPGKEKTLSLETRKNIFLLNMLMEIKNGNWLQGLGTLNGKKSIRRQWNAPMILIVGIFLIPMDIFTAIVLTDSDAFNIDHIYNTLLSYPYGQVLIARLIGWLILILAAFVWYYIDTKELTNVPEDVRNLEQDDYKKTMAQCNSCAMVYKYKKNHGICPECGKYNPPSDTHSNEDMYKTKRAAFGLFKTTGIIILILAGIIISTYIQYQKDNNNSLYVPNIDIPILNLPVEENENTENQENADIPTFTPEELDALLKDIQEENHFETIYHKEIYENNLTGLSGDNYNQVTILIATDGSEKVYWYQFHKYLKASEKYREGEIVFYMGAESDTIKKSDIVVD